MFAPKVAKAQTKATQIPVQKLAPQRATLMARPFGGDAVERVRFLQRIIGNQATSRLLSQWARSAHEPHGPNEKDASEPARAVDALAYTVGREAVFGEGQHAQSTRAGQRVLTHDTQQSQSGTPTIQRQTSYFGPTSGAPSDWAAQAAAAKTSADRAALIQKSVGSTVSDATTASASDVSADAAHLVEYSASNRKINYDDNLNKKQGRDNRSLKDDAGYTLNASGKFYIILGPKAIDPDRYYLPLIILNHELAHVRQNLSGSTLRGNEAELDAWTTSFILDFHRSYLLGDTGKTCFVQDVSTWTQLLDYYQRHGVSATQQDNSVKRIEDYYHSTLETHEGHKNAFRYWIYRSLKSSANPNIADQLNAELKLGISASDHAGKIRQFPCGALKSLAYSAPTLDKPTLSTPTSTIAPGRILDNPSPIFR